MRLSIGGAILSLVLFPSVFVYAQTFGSKESPAARAEKILKLPAGFLGSKYTVVFPVDAGPKAPVIVHIGQVHEDYRGAEYSLKARDEILHNQKRIEVLISELYKNQKIPCVFAEGFAKWSPKALERVRTDRDALIAAITLRAQQSRTFYTKDLEVFDRFISKIKSFRDYNDAEINVKVYEVILRSLERREQVPGDTQKIRAARAKLDTLHKKYGKNPMVLMSGAVNKLFFAHTIPAICPTEDETLNAKAGEAMRKINTLTERSSAKEIARAEREQRDAVLHSRDYAVQAFMRQAARQYRHGNILISVFGDAHDWTNATMLANEAPGEKKYSYIKITPR